MLSAPDRLEDMDIVAVVETGVFFDPDAVDQRHPVDGGRDLDRIHQVGDSRFLLNFDGERIGLIGFAEFTVKMDGDVHDIKPLGAGLRK